MYAEPVGDDESVEAPFLAQDVGQQLPILCGVITTHPVVGAHHAPGATLLHRPFERTEVQLAQWTLVHLDVHRHPIDLGVVAHEVLDGHCDVMGLHGTDVGRRQCARQLGVLAVALEGASAHGCAMQVDGRAEQDVGAFAAGLPAEQIADLGEQFWVPRCAEGDPGGHCDARGTGAPVALAADAGGAVAGLELRDPGVRERTGPPVGLACHEAALVVEREGAERGIDVDHAVESGRYATTAKSPPQAPRQRSVSFWF